MGSESPLRSFLASPGGARLGSFDEVRGFIFAVAGTPELVPPSEWLPEAFQGKRPDFESEEQAQAVVGELMRLYNTAVAGGRRLKKQAPAFRKETLSNLDADSAVARWSRGFLRGHSWLQEEWKRFTPEELEEELASILLVLTFFASRQMAEACRAETGGAKSLGEVAEIMRRTFRDALVGYVRLGQSIYEARLEDSRAAARVEAGRNEPCPCGSGIKYKRCCGAAGN